MTMEAFSIYKTIKNSLHQASWGSVISMLRCDPIVWESVQTPQFIEKLQVYKLVEIDDWSPANLGLISISFKVTAKEIQNSNLPVLDDLYLNRAMSALNGLQIGEAIRNLDESILVALAIREKMVLGETWQSVRREYLRDNLIHYQSVLLCLYGLINRPNEFLAELQLIERQSDSYLLLLQIILANTPAVDGQASILSHLLTRGIQNNWLSNLKVYEFLQTVHLIRPDLATKLGKALPGLYNSISEKQISESGSVIDHLNNLETQLLFAEIQKLADNPDTSSNHLDHAINSLLNIFIDIAPYIKKIRLEPEHSTVEEKDMKFWTNKTIVDELIARESLVNHPLLVKNNLLNFVGNKQYAEAEQLISTNDEIPQSGFLHQFVRAMNEYNRGDYTLSASFARNATTGICSNDTELIEYLTNHTENVVIPLLKLLINLELTQEAVVLARKATSHRNTDVKLHTILGEAHRADFKVNEAVETFYTASLLSPDDLDIRRQLAGCLENIGAWDEAYHERKHIFAIMQNREAHTELTDLHKLVECAIELGFIDEAIQLSEQAIQMDDENGYSCSLIGKALIRNGEIEPAFEQFEKGIQLSPQIPETWLSLAEAQHQLDNIKGAIETLQAASQALPTSAEIHLALGKLQLSQNAFTEALNTFKRGAEIEPLNNQIALKLGTTLQRLGHLIESKQVLESAHLRAPNHIDIAYAYAKVLLQSGERRKALPILEIVVKSNPVSIESFLEFAEAVISSGAVSDGQTTSDEVLNTLHRALELDPVNPIAHALLGEILTIREDFIGAKKAYQVALESNLVEKEEWFARLSLGMGRVALALGQEDVALASLQEALQVDPNNSQIHKAICEVYQAVNLPEDALQSARAALNLAIDDIDTLVWYAEQMVNLSELDAIQSNQATASELSKQIQSEALNALYQANQIAPTRADLVVKLGRIQSILGDHANAAQTFISLIDHEHASVNDLTAAGEYLSQLGDNCGAIASLSKAYSKVQDPSTEASNVLLINLARLYQLDGDHESAIQTLDQALENNPNYAPGYHAKADLLLMLHNEEEALRCISDGLEKASNSESHAQLHLLAGSVLRRRGELKLALEHAQAGLALHDVNTFIPDLQSKSLTETIALTCEIFQAILKPNRGRFLFKDMERKFKIDSTEDLDYCCTYAELFIDELDDEELTSIISQMMEANQDHPRILALQARVFSRRGDHHTSLQVLHTALEAANLKIWNSKEEKVTLLPFSYLPTWYSLFDTALELFQWDTANYVIHQVLDLVPSEPRAHVGMARLIVKKAEYQWLCEKAHVTTNAPGSDAFSPAARARFDQAMASVVLCLDAPHLEITNGETKTDINELNPIVKRWQIRGLAIFGDEEETRTAVTELANLKDQTDGNKPQISRDDMTALVVANVRLSLLGDEDNVDMMIQMARAYGLDTTLPLLVALAVSDIKPRDVINLFDELSEPTQPKDSPLYAMRKALTARLLSNSDQLELAKSSIDEALAVLHNEPKWHNLAANIYQNLSNVGEAIHHFDEAIRLEPHNLENHLGLGKILIENSEIDTTYLKRAIQVLERACRIEPENYMPWFYLSRAYLLAADVEQAASYADMAITLDSGSIQLLSLRGEIALHQDQSQAALDFANQALSIDEHDNQAILIKSQALRELGRVEQALEVLESAMEFMDDPLALQIEYAGLLNDMRGPQASFEALQQLADQNPDNPKVLSMLAKNMADTGQIELAIQTAQRALQAGNGSQPAVEKAEVHFLLGNLLFRTRQLDQAVYHLSESISLTPNFIDSYLELGRALLERRQYRQALEAYQRATRIAPNDPRPHYQAGIVYKEGKDYQASEMMLRRAADLAPDDVSIRRQLAAVVALNLVHNPRSKG